MKLKLLVKPIEYVSTFLSRYPQLFEKLYSSGGNAVLSLFSTVFQVRSTEEVLARSAEMISPKLDGAVTSAANIRLVRTVVEKDKYELHRKLLMLSKNSNEYSWDIVWRNVLIFIILNTGSLYGLWLMITQAKWLTCLFLFVYAVVAGMGITAGAHRLWAHRAYRAKLPLRIFLMLCQSAALQNDIHEWVRDHRVHHKFTDTDADPHNSRRGFFFSHMGWLMVKKHKDVTVKGQTVDMSDLEVDAVINFQKRYYVSLAFILCFLIPIFTPWYFWGEGWWISFYVTGVFRYTISLHSTWLVNSAAHIYGTKPYDKNINPRENKFVAWAALGEGWHNYHHVFPWDYKTAELGNYRLNITTAFIDFMAKVGWAYDLKTVTQDMIMKRIERTGELHK